MKDEYKRENFAEGKEFAQKIKDELKCKIVWIEVNNKKIPKEPTIEFGKKIGIIQPRANCLFQATLFWKQKPDHIFKAMNRDDIDTLLNEFKRHIEEMKKNKNNGKKKPKDKSLDVEDIKKSVKERMTKLSDNSKGISVPKGVMPNHKWFLDFLKGEALDCDWENRIIFRK